jgi:small-conductance mechanosensitive channel
MTNGSGVTNHMMAGDPWVGFSTNILPLLNWQLWIVPGMLVALGIISGIILEKLLLGSIRRILNHTAIELNAEIAATLRGVILWIFGLWGAHMATYSIHFLDRDTLEVVRRIIFSLGMLLAIQIAAKISVALARFYLIRSGGARTLPNTSIFENIVRVLVFILGFIMLLQTLGVSVLPLITALGIGGLAMSLALQDTLANLLAGIQMLLAGQIRVGDTIQLESGQTGKVEDIGWRTTTLRQLSDNLVILPNSKLASNVIQNFTQPHPDLTITLILTVSTENDLQTLEKLASDVAAEVGKRLIQEKNPGRSKPVELKPIVRYQSYGESWLNMAISLPFKSVMDGGLVRHELIKALSQRFRSEGIEIPFSRNIMHFSPVGGAENPL